MTSFSPRRSPTGYFRCLGRGSITFIDNYPLDYIRSFSFPYILWAERGKTTEPRFTIASLVEMGLQMTGISADDVSDALADAVAALMIDNKCDVRRITDAYPPDALVKRAADEAAAHGLTKATRLIVRRSVPLTREKFNLRNWLTQNPPAA